MPAQIPDSIADWSTTAGSNQPSGSANVGPDLDDNLRAMQAAVRQTYTRGSIASAATCDIGTVDAELITVTGTTTITSLGSTLGATGYGVHKLLTFAGALTLTNSASLACITSANITTAAGDSCMVEFSASGWTMLWYARKSGAPVVVQSFALSDLSNATANKTLANALFAQNWGWAGTGVSNTEYLTFEWTGTGSNGRFFNVKGNLNAQSIFRVIQTQNSQTMMDVGPSAILIRGYSPTSGAAAIGGGLQLLGGEGRGADSGAVTISGGTSNNGAGNGGNVNISAGAGAGVGTPGVVYLYAPDSNASQVRVENTGITVYGNTAFVLDQAHLFVDDTNGSPTITAGGGTGATISGSDVAFEVTFGTGSPTSVTVTFANAWATAPLIQVSGTQSGQILHYAAATNTVQILSSTAFSSGTKVSVFCVGKQ